MKTNRYERNGLRLLDSGDSIGMHPLAWQLGRIFGDSAGVFAQWVYRRVGTPIRCKWYLQRWYWTWVRAALNEPRRKDR